MTSIDEYLDISWEILSIALLLFIKITDFVVTNSLNLLGSPFAAFVYLTVNVYLFITKILYLIFKIHFFNLILYLSNFVSPVLLSITGFFKFLVLFLILTIVIATVTLIERKILALTQRRVGPNYIGYKGRLQFIADALKMLVKHIAVLTKVNKVLFIVIPALICSLIYIYWSNILWGSSLSFVEVEYNLLIIGALSGANALLLTVAGFLTVNKYSCLSSVRSIIASLSTEIILTLLFVSFAILCESLSLSLMLSAQERFLIGLIYLVPTSPIVIFVFFLETARIPFDFTEAESELIAGYTTEYGGFYFALFYLGEYFHLFCFSAIYSICLFGG